MKRKIAILGSSGSIGRQSLEVCAFLGFEVTVLAAHHAVEMLFQQALQVKPALLVLEDETAAKRLKEMVLDAKLDCEVRAGRKAVLEAASYGDTDTVVASMVGMAGLEPVLEAIRSGKHIALANKETLVAAGKLVMKESRKHGVKILPVDSEHSAIWQCLQGGEEKALSRVFLTCSGGPFRGKTRDELQTVTIKEALKHPTWSMGGKISIDSATLVNKGLELIEACHLFDITEEQIQVVVHPESIIHSMIAWRDQSVIAQLGFPDMRLPIQYALTYPKRQTSLEAVFNPFDSHCSALHFEAVDENTFPAIALARQAQQEGECLPIVFNAANEIAVDLFLQGQLSFLRITDTIARCLDAFSGEDRTGVKTLAGILDLDRRARVLAKELCR